jgi:hypothetical protein
MRASAVACLLCAAATPAAGFLAPGLQQAACRSLQHTTVRMTAAGAGAADRRGFLAAAVSSAAVALAVAPSEATVYFEIDRYGDKELKLGTVSKIRQAWRNKMLEKPELAPAILSLAITDALGYNARVRASVNHTSEHLLYSLCSCYSHLVGSRVVRLGCIHTAHNIVCHNYNARWLQAAICRGHCICCTCNLMHTLMHTTAYVYPETDMHVRTYQNFIYTH